MNASQSSVERLRHAYQQWHETRGASVNTWLDLMAEDVVMRSLPDGGPGMEFTKGRNSKTEAEQYFSGLSADWELIHVVPEEFISQGDRVVVLSKVAFRFKATGKIAHSPKVDVYRFRDGLIVEFREFFDSAAALAATLT